MNAGCQMLDAAIATAGGVKRTCQCSPICCRSRNRGACLPAAKGLLPVFVRGENGLVYADGHDLKEKLTSWKRTATTFVGQVSTKSKAEIKINKQSLLTQFVAWRQVMLKTFLVKRCPLTKGRV